jgi:TonB family protein
MSSAEAGPGGAPSATVFPETGLVSAADPAGEAPAASGDPDGTGPAGGAPGGSGALTLGPAEGPLTTVYLGSTDPRYADYLGTIAALLEPEWRDAFPRERALYMQQGEVVIEWVVERNGAISGPRVLRPSGVPPFDRNVLSGFRRAAVRFPHPPPAMPLPVRIRAPYRYRNPMFD